MRPRGTDSSNPVPSSEESVANLGWMPHKNLEYSGLDGTFLSHCRLGVRVVLWMQWLAAAAYPKPPGLTSAKSRLLARFQNLEFMDGH